MCDIKRLKILKKQQARVVDSFKRVNPLSALPASYVSETGLTYTDIREKIDKISDCASILELSDSFIKTGDTFEQVMKVTAANYCKQHVICPICADKMQSKRRARFNDPIKEQAAKVETGERYAYMVTYTIKDGESLSERLAHLKEAKKNFRKMGQRRKNSSRSCGEAGKIKAAVSTIEIKRGKNSGLWHAHSHDLVFTDRPLDYRMYNPDKKRKLDQKYKKRIPADKLKEIALRTSFFNGSIVPASKISQEWLSASGGDSMSISVERIQHVPKTATGKKKRMFSKMDYVDSVAYQAREVLKYISKPNENNVSDSLIILNETYNKRMVSTYGQFRGVAGDDYIDDREGSESFVMVWKNGTYTDAMPGTVRDIEGEEATETRSEAGKALGEYRRRRRSLVADREHVGEELFRVLDELKMQFRKKINSVWAKYRSMKKVSNIAGKGNCDNYSQTLALAGMYLPDTDSKDLYGMAFY